jgi:hypothetical protein
LREQLTQPLEIIAIDRIRIIVKAGNDLVRRCGHHAIAAATGSNTVIADQYLEARKRARNRGSRVAAAAVDVDQDLRRRRIAVMQDAERLDRPLNALERRHHRRHASGGAHAAPRPSKCA